MCASVVLFQLEVVEVGFRSSSSPYEIGRMLALLAKDDSGQICAAPMYPTPVESRHNGLVVPAPAAVSVRISIPPVEVTDRAIKPPKPDVPPLVILSVLVGLSMIESVCAPAPSVSPERINSLAKTPCLLPFQKKKLPTPLMKPLICSRWIREHYQCYRIKGRRTERDPMTLAKRRLRHRLESVPLA